VCRHDKWCLDSDQCLRKRGSFQHFHPRCATKASAKSVPPPGTNVLRRSKAILNSRVTLTDKCLRFWCVVLGYTVEGVKIALKSQIRLLITAHCNSNPINQYPPPLTLSREPRPPSLAYFLVKVRRSFRFSFVWSGQLLTTPLVARYTSWARRTAGPLPTPRV
jgi:hypothetical protein